MKSDEADCERAFSAMKWFFDRLRTRSVGDMFEATVTGASAVNFLQNLEYDSELGPIKMRSEVNVEHNFRKLTSRTLGIFFISTAVSWQRTKSASWHSCAPKSTRKFVRVARKRMVLLGPVVANATGSNARSATHGSTTRASTSTRLQLPRTSSGCASGASNSRNLPTRG